MTHDNKIICWVLTFALPLLVVALLVYPCRVIAQDYPPGDDQIVPLNQNDRAPFAGQLFSTDTAIRWGFRMQRLRFQLEADVQQANDLCQVQTNLLDTKLSLERDRYTFNLQLLGDTLEQERTRANELAALVAEGTPWYETFGFGLGVGMVASAVLVGLAAWLVASTL